MKSWRIWIWQQFVASAVLSAACVSAGYCVAPVEMQVSDVWPEGVHRAEISQSIRAASAGWAEEQFRVGTFYDEGGILPLDYQAAAQWYAKASAQNYFLAQFRLGKLYHSGHVGDGNKMRGCALFEEALKHDSAVEHVPDMAEVMLYFGDCLMTPAVEQPRIVQAMLWYKRAAMLGNAQGCFRLGQLHQYGQAIGVDLKRAHFWYEKAASLGHAQASLLLGQLYERGEGGVEKNLKKALSFIRQAARSGLVEAQFALASLYEKEGEALIVRDNAGQKAFQWYLFAAMQGHAQAQNNVAYFYEKGKGVALSLPKARLWYERAALSGLSQAQFNLGLFHEKMHPPDYVQALHWYQQAAAQGELQAFFPLGFLYYEGIGAEPDYHSAYQWFKQAAVKGDAMAAFSLGVLYANAQGVTGDDRQARFWYEKAAYAGKHMAQYNLAQFYEEGRGGERDYAQALHFYQLAAAQGDVDALVKAGFFYEYGIGVEVDRQQAFEFYKQAGLMGDEEAQYRLGMFYGREGGRNLNGFEYDKARFWLEKAAASGHRRAQLRLSILYRLGLGGEKDVIKAQFWQDWRPQDNR